MKTILLTTFYAPGMPLVILFSLVGLTLIYWSDKYLFLRRNSLPPPLTDRLNNSMLDYLDLMVVTFSLGNLFFGANLINSNGFSLYGTKHRIITLITLGIALLHILLPIKSITSKLSRVRNESVKTQTYNQARSYFYTDYDLENPLTRHQALDELIGQFYRDTDSPKKEFSLNRAGITSSVLYNML